MISFCLSKVKAPEINLTDQPSLWNFVKRGGDVSVKVYFDAKPIPEAVWYHNGIELSLCTKIKTEIYENCCLLLIKGI